MIAFLQGPGFLHTHGSMGADLSLVITIIAAATLTVGIVLAKKKRFREHRWVQTASVGLNAVPVVFWMIRSLWLYVVPGLPGILRYGPQALTAVHAVTGAIGVVLGVVIVVRANQLWARGKSLRPWVPAMRAAYAVYLASLALGIALYVVIYG
jgi:uncharacterized membrane protein YozB (DUF420 family)